MRDPCRALSKPSEALSDTRLQQVMLEALPCILANGRVLTHARNNNPRALRALRQPASDARPLRGVAPAVFFSLRSAKDSARRAPTRENRRAFPTCLSETLLRHRVRVSDPNLQVTISEKCDFACSSVLVRTRAQRSHAVHTRTREHIGCSGRTRTLSATTSRVAGCANAV